MKDLGRELKLQFQERLGSPLIGSFVISWALWNHRLLFVLFSDLPVRARFEFIDTVLYPDGLTILRKAIIAPGVFALLYIYLYPIVAQFINKSWLPRQVKLKEQSDMFLSGRLLTPEEGEKIINEARRIRSEAREEIRKVYLELENIRKPAAEITDATTAPDKDPNAEAIEKLRRRIDDLARNMDRDVYQRPEEIFPGLLGPEPNLSEDAIQLLVDAAKDERGAVRYVPVIGGLVFEANGKQFIEGEEPRSRARWESALQELISAKYLEHLNGQYHRVTKAGFNRADRLKPPQV